VLVEVGVLIVGILLVVIYLVEDCGAFGRVLDEVGLFVLWYGIVYFVIEVVEVVCEIGYLVCVLLFYVFGGCGMEIVYDDEILFGYVEWVIEVLFEYLVLVDWFLDDVIEIDVDVLFDGDELYFGVVMEYIEEVGIYFGDLVCVLLLVMLGYSEIELVWVSIEAIVRGVGVMVE